MKKINFDKVQNLAGFTVSNAKGGERVKVLTRASITSDEPEFYDYIEQISNLFLGKAKVFADSVFQFLVLIHEDLNADLYINDFQVIGEIMPKRDIQKGEIVSKSDIADVRRLNFPDIKITEKDKVIYCFKVGWKFGLFFDLNRPEKLDANKMSLDLGALYRYLSFQYVYKVLESADQFEEMIKDGWFPFIEIIGSEYKTLSKIYQNKFDFENRIKQLVESFDKTRLKKIVNKWWGKQIFKDKQPIIEAGVNAYLQNNSDGFINCIKTLLSEIDGIIRLQYFRDTGKGRKIPLLELLEHMIDKGKKKSGSVYSLFLPLPFFAYLKDMVFAGFDLEDGKIDLSRHTVSHGVSRAVDYTKLKALQTILILDQLYFYI